MKCCRKKHFVLPIYCFKWLFVYSSLLLFFVGGILKSEGGTHSILSQNESRPIFNAKFIALCFRQNSQWQWICLIKTWFFGWQTLLHILLEAFILELTESCQMGYCMHPIYYTFNCEICVIIYSICGLFCCYFAFICHLQFIIILNFRSLLRCQRLFRWSSWEIGWISINKT